MKHHTKRHTRRHRRGRRMMRGGSMSMLNPSTYTDSANAIGAGPYETGTIGDFKPLMAKFDTSPEFAHTNALDSAYENKYITATAQSGAASMQQSSQNGGKRQNNRQYQNQQQNQNQYQNQYQNQFQQQNNRQNNRQYQNQQQNQRGGVWNQMIGEAVAPLVLLGLQQYYGPRSKSNRGNRSTKGKRTRRYRK